MLSGIRLEVFERHLQIITSAELGKDNFINELCNFLVFEFDFKEVSIYESISKNQFKLLGNSSYAAISKKEIFSANELFSSIIQSSFVNFNTDFHFEVNDSELPTKTGLVLFQIGENNKFALKVIRKVNFNFHDKDALKQIVSLISIYQKIWLENRSGETKKTDKRLISILSNSIKGISNKFSSIIGSISILESDKLFPSQSSYFNNIKSTTHIIQQNLSDIEKYLSIQLNRKFEKESELFCLNELIKEVLKNFNNINISHNIKNNSKINVQDDKQKLRFIIKTLISIIVESDSNANIYLNINLNSNRQTEIIFTIDSDKIKLLLSSLNDKNLLFDENKFNNNIISIFLILEYISKLGYSLHTRSLNLQKHEIILSLSSNKHSDLGDMLSNINKTGDLKKVLIVESDEATTTLLKKYLEKWNYIPVLAHSKKEVIYELKNNKYLAVILDVETENENSLKLLQRIKKLDEAKYIPVIVCAVEPEKEEAFMMGAVEYFLKPINYNNLVEILTSFNLRRNSNVLCIDDDLPTLNLVKQAIETAGFNAIAENQSDKVIDLIKDKDLDLAIVDLEMPHPNGYELIQEIKAIDRFSSLPIIIYTGKEDYKEELKNIEGMFNYLMNKKATKMEDLELAINEMIMGYETPSTIEELKENEDEIKILLVEDYKHSQIIVTRLLKKNNFHNIVVVENGEEALNFIQKEKVDLILMDMQMPVMNGFEAIERIREIPEYRETPIISITAFAMKGDREKCLEAGATDYLPKPIDSKEFIEKVKYYTNTFG